MTVVVDRRDPRWNDPVWRTENFLALCADHQLSVSEVAAYTEKSIETVIPEGQVSRTTVPRAFRRRDDHSHARRRPP